MPLQTMTRISVPVTFEERELLRKGAKEDMRDIRSQARYLLRLALGLTNHTDSKNDKTANTYQGDGGLVTEK